MSCTFLSQEVSCVSATCWGRPQYPSELTLGEWSNLRTGDGCLGVCHIASHHLPAHPFSIQHIIDYNYTWFVKVRPRIESTKIAWFSIWLYPPKKIWQTCHLRRVLKSLNQPMRSLDTWIPSWIPSWSGPSIRQGRHRKISRRTSDVLGSCACASARRLTATSVCFWRKHLLNPTRYGKWWETNLKIL